MRMHLGERPNLCNSCQKYFTSKYYLNKHNRAHTKDKALTCLKCFKRFFTSRTLNRHAKNHRENGKFICSQCNKIYSNADRLKTHKCICESTNKLSKFRVLYIKQDIMNKKIGGLKNEDNIPDSMEEGELEEEANEEGQLGCSR